MREPEKFTQYEVLSVSGQGSDKIGQTRYLYFNSHLILAHGCGFISTSTVESFAHSGSPLPDRPFQCLDTRLHYQEGHISRSSACEVGSGSRKGFSGCDDMASTYYVYTDYDNTYMRRVKSAFPTRLVSLKNAPFPISRDTNSLLPEADCGA